MFVYMLALSHVAAAYREGKGQKKREEAGKNEPGYRRHIGIRSLELVCLISSGTQAGRKETS